MNEKYVDALIEVLTGEKNFLGSDFDIDEQFIKLQKKMAENAQKEAKIGNIENAQLL